LLCVKNIQDGSLGLLGTVCTFNELQHHLVRI